MENNEIMNEGIEMIEDVVADEAAGFGVGTGVLIGAGVALAAYAGVKLAKKLYANFKAKKELRKLDNEIDVDPEDLVDVRAK